MLLPGTIVRFPLNPKLWSSFWASYPVDQQAVKEVVLSGEVSLSNRDHVRFLLPSAGGI